MCQCPTILGLQDAPSGQADQEGNDPVARQAAYQAYHLVEEREHLQVVSRPQETGKVAFQQEVSRPEVVVENAAYLEEHLLALEAFQRVGMPA